MMTAMKKITTHGGFTQQRQLRTPMAYAAM